MDFKPCLVAALCLLTFANAQFDCPAGWSGRGPLYDYVFCEDPAYNWEILETIVEPGVTTYILNVTSQTWYDETLHSWPLWWHYVSVSIPDQITYTDKAAFYVSSGSNEDSIPNTGTRHIGEMRTFANRTGIVSGAIRQTPNQPIKFTYNHGPTDILRYRKEDDLIAWTWREFLENPEDPNILLRWPMCKGTARAMDALTELTQELTGNVIEHFMISGQSKRGWTVWLHAAIDDRVIAVAPTVLSCLNMQEVMRHYFTSLGGWPLAFGPYYAENITTWMDHPHTDLLEEMVDPYLYRQNLTMPKLVVSGASDEFFFMDDYWYWWDDMVGQKHLWLMENTSHSISASPLEDNYWTALEAFYISVIEDFQFPDISWSRNVTETTGSITVHVPEGSNLISITSWSYLTPLEVFPRRDFRRYVGIPPYDIGIEDKWEEKPVQDLGDGYYYVEHDIPEPINSTLAAQLEGSPGTFNDTDSGLRPDRIESCSSQFLGFFIKMTFEGPTPDRPFIFTTEPQILPDCMPYETCYGSDCQGILV